MPSEFYAGSGVSLLTLTTWLGATRRRRQANTGREVSAHMIRIGIIGYGYWGPNLVRNFAERAGRAGHGGVATSARSGSPRSQRRYPGDSRHDRPADLIADPAVDAVVDRHAGCACISSWRWRRCAPASTCWSRSRSPRPATRRAALIDEAERRRLVLMVDHTFVYTGAVRKIRELVAGGELGDIYYYDSVRINLGLFQHDVNVLWDLAVHDLSIMDFVLPQQPVAVSATGLAHVPGQPENIAYMTMFFDGALIAHVHVNWLAPVKVRRTLLGGSRRMIVFDDLEASEKIKVYDSGISVDPSPENVYQMLVGYRTGDMWAPKLAMTRGAEGRGRALRRVRDAAARAPHTDGEAGLARGAPARGGHRVDAEPRAARRHSGSGRQRDSVRRSAGAVPIDQAGDRCRGRCACSTARSSSSARRSRPSSASSPPTAARPTPSASTPARARCTWRCWRPASVPATR